MGAVIGVDLEQDQLVLTRGRDFRWNFENLDDRDQPVDYPDGTLYLELQTRNEVNCLQQVNVNRATGGTYSFIFDGQETGAIDYYDVTDNPHGMDGDVTDALKALPNIGVGNVICHPASLYPVWRIQLQVVHDTNEVQKVELLPGTNGGTFKLSFDNKVTAAIAWNASAAAVQSALEALPNIGVGDVAVTLSAGAWTVTFQGALALKNVPQLIPQYSSTVWFFFTSSTLTGGNNPGAKVTTITQGTPKLSERRMNLLNLAINDFFNSFEDFLGVDLDFVIHNDYQTTFTATSKKSYDETGLILMDVEVTNTALNAAFDSVDGLLGMTSDILVAAYWNHTYNVEFIGDLGISPQPLLASDISALTGPFNDQVVDVEYLEEGRSPTTIWPFEIDGSTASIKIESEITDLIPPRVHWQLVFKPTGEPAGGDPIARGTVKVVEPDAWVDIP